MAKPLTIQSLAEKGAVLNRDNYSLAKQMYTIAKSILASTKAKAKAADADAEDEAEDEDSDDPEPTKKVTTKTKQTKESSGFSMADLALALRMQLKKIYPNAYLLDVFEDSIVFDENWSGNYYELPYTISDQGVASFGDPIQVTRKVTYVPLTNESLDATEALSTVELTELPIKLVERAIRSDGTTKIKIIAPGAGSSAFYPREVLKRDGPNVFKAGTKMYWDHQTAAQEAAQPEGSLDRLAAKLTSNARWQDDPVDGPGLYADAKVYKHYADVANEIAEDIGISIRASGKAKIGDVPGIGRMPILEELTSVKSVDFVTTPGAGGKVVSLFESAKQRSFQESKGSAMNEDEVKRLIEAATKPLVDQNTALVEALRLTEAKSQINTTLIRLAKQHRLPGQTVQRLAEGLYTRYPVKDGLLDTTALDVLINEAVKGAVTELAAVTGNTGAVFGLGSSAAPAATDPRAELVEAFKALNMSDSAAKHAAEGRG